MLSKKYRFHGHGSLRYVYKNGQAVRSHLLTVKHVPNSHRRNLRFSIVVSKKVMKSAVGRNRIRRRLYEVIRGELPHIHGVHDVVVIAISAELLSLPADELKEAVRMLFTQADLYK
jgi:ribonuclease P protein component